MSQYHLTRQELNLLSNRFPELCRTCWECEGKGKKLWSPGTLVDCPHCHAIGKVPDVIEITRKILRDTFPPDIGQAYLRGTYLYPPEETNDNQT